MVRSATFVCFMFVGTAYANERSAELVKSFQAFCASAPLDFAALDAKATAMKLAVRKDVGTPQQTGKLISPGPRCRGPIIFSPRA